MDNRGVNFVTHDHREAVKSLPAESVESLERLLSSIDIAKKDRKTRFIRNTVLGKLHDIGWSDEARLDPLSSITITSVRENVGLCFQTGNMARIYADLLKLQLLFSREKIVGAIFIIFTRLTASELGDNIANFDRLTKELEIFYQVISVPIFTIGLEALHS
jgi:hypothetical protein